MAFSGFGINIREERAALPSRSVDDLLSIKLRVDDSIRDVKAQVDEARASAAAEGAYADRDWWQRANGFIRIASRFSQEIQLEIRRRKTSEKSRNREIDQQSYATALKKVMNELLTGVQKQAIYDRANEIHAEQLEAFKASQIEQVA